MQFEFLSSNRSGDVTKQLCGAYVGRAQAQIENIPVSSILYFFAGTVGRNGLVTIAGFHADCFNRNRYYARTKRGVALVKNPLVRLAGHQFVQAHQSIVVSLTGWLQLDLDEKGFLFTGPGEPREWVPISRRLYPAVRRALGLPTRRKNGGPWSGGPWKGPGSVRRRPATTSSKRHSHNGSKVRPLPQAMARY